MQKVRAELAKPLVRAGAVVVLAAVVGIGVWLGVRDTGGSQPALTNVPAAAAAAAAAANVTEDGLKVVSSVIRRPIYWAGKTSDVAYELTRLVNGRIYVRYLPKGVAAGTGDPYLTIGTYPVKGAFAATTAIANQAGSVKVPVKGGVAFYTKKLPTNVYVAFKDSDFQVEIYDPSNAKALKAVSKIAAVETAGVTFQLPASAQSTTPAQVAKPKNVPASDIVATAAAVGHPIYWIGRKPSVTYELTKANDGRVWVRYLPVNAASAAKTAATLRLTIGTYPVKNAYTATVAAAKRAGSTVIPIKGGIGFYAAASPGNVYLAFKGINYQIEVFDPSAATAQRLVRTGQIRPVR